MEGQTFSTPKNSRFIEEISSFAGTIDQMKNPRKSGDLRGL